MPASPADPAAARHGQYSRGDGIPSHSTVIQTDIAQAMLQSGHYSKTRGTTNQMADARALEHRQFLGIRP